jgi:hypothetical protein
VLVEIKFKLVPDSDPIFVEKSTLQLIFKGHYMCNTRRCSGAQLLKPNRAHRRPTLRSRSGYVPCGPVRQSQPLGPTAKAACTSQIGGGHQLTGFFELARARERFEVLCTPTSRTAACHALSFGRNMETTTLHVPTARLIQRTSE